MIFILSGNALLAQLPTLIRATYKPMRRHVSQDTFYFKVLAYLVKARQVNVSKSA